MSKQPKKELNKERPKELNKERINSIQPTDKRQEIADGLLPSFYLVVQPLPSGAKGFCIRYRRPGDGKHARMVIPGRWPHVSLKEARAEARKALARIRDQREDPVKRAADAKGKTIKTFGDLSEAFLKHKRNTPKKPLRPSTADAYERMLRNDILPVWGNRKFAEIRRGDIQTLLEEIAVDAENPRPILANRMHSMLGSLFSWALQRGYVEANPVHKLEKPADENARERVLSDDELALVLAATDRLPHHLERDFVRFLLHSLQRRNEVADMERREVANQTWTIPAERAKNKCAHDVPLTAPMLQVLDRRACREDSKLVFGSRGTGPYRNFARLKLALDAAVTELNGGTPIPQWQFHDFRRTGATVMQRLGVAVHVVEKLLNHKGGTFKGIVGVYQRHSYAAEQKEALEAWAKHLLGLRAKGHNLGVVGG